MNNFRRQNEEIASSACLKPAASTGKILHVGMPRAIWRYMLWWSGWARFQPKPTTNAGKSPRVWSAKPSTTLQTRDELPTFGAPSPPQPSKRGKTTRQMWSAATKPTTNASKNTRQMFPKSAKTTTNARTHYLQNALVIQPNII